MREKVRDCAILRWIAERVALAAVAPIAIAEGGDEHDGVPEAHAATANTFRRPHTIFADGGNAHPIRTVWTRIPGVARQARRGEVSKGRRVEESRPGASGLTNRVAQSGHRALSGVIGAGANRTEVGLAIRMLDEA